MLLSIIIPCYNHGHYLHEAYDSLDLDKINGRDDVEVIIVNDGSTDEYTLKVLKEFESRNVKVINQSNSGLAHARNAGILESKGKYIVPLDSDNRLIMPSLREALFLMESDSTIDAIYSDAYLFGAQDGKRHVEDFDILKMLQHNYIDACALIRRDVFERFGGYDPDMPKMGNEDWELWIRLFFEKCRILRFEEPIYHYRVSENSMSETVTRPGFQNNLKYIYYKHAFNISGLFYGLSYEDLEKIKWFGDFRSYSKKNRIKLAIKLLLGRSVV